MYNKYGLLTKGEVKIARVGVKVNKHITKKRKANVQQAWSIDIQLILTQTSCAGNKDVQLFSI